MIDKILERIDNLLKKANCETLVLGNFINKKIKFCFDLLLRKDDMIVSVKIFPNIDNINPDLISDIKSLSQILRSKPLLIGIRNRYQKLEDYTIYIREGLPFITLNTFENILTNDIYPYVLAKRGGGIVFLDGLLMKKLREKKIISRKELSEKLGVTKRTVCAYENERMHPSEKIAEKIIKILEHNDLFKKINIFKWNIRQEKDEKEIIEEFELSDFESHVQDIVNDIGISSYWYKKGSIPFKLSLFSESKNEKLEGFYPLFSGIFEEQNKLNKLNFECLKLFNDLFHKTSFFITNNDVKIPKTYKNIKVPVVKIKNLEEVDDEEEFIELIKES